LSHWLEGRAWSGGQHPASDLATPVAEPARPLRRLAQAFGGSFTPNDEFFDNQVHLRFISAPEAWSATMGGSGVAGNGVRVGEARGDGFLVFL
jgi:hypothetical protein